MHVKYAPSAWRGWRWVCFRRSSYRNGVNWGHWDLLRDAKRSRRRNQRKPSFKRDPNLVNLAASNRVVASHLDWLCTTIVAIRLFVTMMESSLCDSLTLSQSHKLLNQSKVGLVRWLYEKKEKKNESSNKDDRHTNRRRDLDSLCCSDTWRSCGNFSTRLLVGSIFNFNFAWLWYF